MGNLIDPPSEQTTVLSNAEIADRLASLAQLLSSQKENPYKVKAYRRAATHIRNLPESLDEMVRREEDLTQFAGIGAAIKRHSGNCHDGNAHKAGKIACPGTSFSDSSDDSPATLQGN